MLFILLYCDKKQGKIRELPDLSQQQILPAPRWASQGILYQVFPRVFTPEGTFKALERRLEYIRDLGVTIIWLMPIFPIGEEGRKGTVGSPYAVRDFRSINPDYGTEQDFRELVQAIHRHGMKVIVDIVPNHGANDNILLPEHPDWFMRDKAGNFTREVPDWSDVIDFNYQNPRMREYMRETFLYWVRDFDIDGYRCDVAGMVPYAFWTEILAGLRKIKSDIYLLAEWEDPEILLTGFHSDYGWTEFHLLYDIRKKRNRSAEIFNLIAEKDRRYPGHALPMRFLENHDEQRSIQEFGIEAIQTYATLLFTVPGIPLIYAGQEIGETDKPSLFEKSVLDWDHADLTLQEMYRSLISLRRKFSCFTQGEFMSLPVASLKGSVGAFLREDSCYAAFFIGNLKNKPASQVVVSLPEELRNRFKTLRFRSLENPEHLLDTGEIHFPELAPFHYMLFIAEK